MMEMMSWPTSNTSLVHGRHGPYTQLRVTRTGQSGMRAFLSWRSSRQYFMKVIDDGGCHHSRCRCGPVAAETHSAVSNDVFLANLRNASIRMPSCGSRHVIQFVEAFRDGPECRMLVFVWKAVVGASIEDILLHHVLAFLQGKVGPPPRKDLDVKCLMHQVLLALQWAHNASIVHRDLQVNQLITDETRLSAPHPRIVLSDFHRADRIRSNGHAAKHSHSYIEPPELVVDSTAADIWAAAAGIFSVFILGVTVSDLGHELSTRCEEAKGSTRECEDAERSRSMAHLQHALQPGQHGDALRPKWAEFLAARARVGWRALLETVSLFVEESPQERIAGTRVTPAVRRALGRSKSSAGLLATYKLDQLGRRGEELLAAMLDFIPARRPTAVEALRHPYFLDLDPRCPSHPAHRPLCLAPAGISQAIPDPINSSRQHVER